MSVTMIGNLNVNVHDIDSVCVYLNMLTENDKTVTFRKDNVDIFSCSGETSFEPYDETILIFNGNMNFGKIEIHFDTNEIQDIIFDPSLVIVRLK